MSARHERGVKRKEKKRNSFLDLCPPRHSSRFHRSSIHVSSLTCTNERLGLGFASETSAGVGDFHSFSAILHRLTERTLPLLVETSKETNEFDTESSIYARIPIACLSLSFSRSRYITQFAKRLKDTTGNRSTSTFLFVKERYSWNRCWVIEIIVNRFREWLHQSDIAPACASLSKCLNVIEQRNKRMTRLLILCQGNNPQSSYPSTAISVPCTERSAESIPRTFVSAEASQTSLRCCTILGRAKMTNER